MSDVRVPSKLMIGAHAVASAWVLLMGAGHQLHVLWRGWRGTLSRPEEFGALLLVGAGLLLSASLMTLSLAPLSKGRTSSALLSVVSLLLVLCLIWLQYGPRFLMGSITLAILDLVALSTMPLFTSAISARD